MTQNVGNDKFKSLLAGLKLAAENGDAMNKSLSAPDFGKPEDKPKPELTEEEKAAEAERLRLEAEKNKGKTANAGTSNDNPEFMGKSFIFVDEEGKDQQGVDVSALMKSLPTHLAAIETNSTKVDEIMEALGTMVGIIGQRDEMIKSLQHQVTQLASLPGGRKSILTIADRGSNNLENIQKSLSALGGAQAEIKSAGQMTGSEIMAKALTAFEAGKITGSDLAILEESTNSGSAIPNDLMKSLSAV